MPKVQKQHLKKWRDVTNINQEIEQEILLRSLLSHEFLQPFLGSTLQDSRNPRKFTIHHSSQAKERGVHHSKAPKNQDKKKKVHLRTLFHVYK